MTQRPVGEDSITLGPQGGLARGMSSGRGPSPFATTPDIPSPGDSRRVAAAGLNGYGSASDRTPYSQNRFTNAVSYEQSVSQERNRSYANRDAGIQDRSSDRVSPVSAPTVQLASSQGVASEKALPEERLRDMSLAAIKEFYRYHLFFVLRNIDYFNCVIQEVVLFISGVFFCFIVVCKYKTTMNGHHFLCNWGWALRQGVLSGIDV